MTNKKLPPPWTSVYQGDDECKFFKTLARTEFDWRGISAISKESGLSKKRCEEICQKYYGTLVFQSPKNEDHWGYWEKVPQMLEGKKKSIAQTDQEERIDKVINPYGWQIDDVAVKSNRDSVTFTHSAVASQKEVTSHNGNKANKNGNLFPNDIWITLTLENVNEAIQLSHERTGTFSGSHRMLVKQIEEAMESWGPTDNPAGQ